MLRQIRKRNKSSEPDQKDKKYENLLQTLFQNSGNTIYRFVLLCICGTAHKYSSNFVVVQLEEYWTTSMLTVKPAPTTAMFKQTFCGIRTQYHISVHFF